MKAALGKDSHLSLTFESREEAREFFASASAQQGFVAKLDQALKQFARLELMVDLLEAGRSESVDFASKIMVEVVQLLPNGMVAFQFCDGAPTRSALRVLSASAAERMIKPGRERAEGDQSPLFRIRAMNPNERFRLATKATRTERQILLRDSSPQVLLGLLAHPRLENKELLELLKSPHSNSGMMERVSKNIKWMSNPDIRFLVVKSPKTPAPIAIKLLDTLPVTELRKLARGSHSREALKRAALRVYLKRSGQGRGL